MYIYIYIYIYIYEGLSCHSWFSRITLLWFFAVSFSFLLYRLFASYHIIYIYIYRPKKKQKTNMHTKIPCINNFRHGLRRWHSVSDKYTLSSRNRLHSLEREAAGIGLHVTAHKTKYICFNQRGDISTQNVSSLKLVDKEAVSHQPRLTSTCN